SMKTTKKDARVQADRRSPSSPGVRTDGQERRVDARRLIDEINERQQELDAVAFKPPSDGRLRRKILAFTVVLCGGILGLDLYTKEPPPPVFSDAELNASLEFLVYLTVQGVEEFRERTGTLPPSLEAAGLDDPFVRYEAMESGFRVEAQQGSRSLVFNEGDDIQPLAASFWALQRRVPE
ncbi:MAG: hypothetical protein ACR2QM_08255, partial [Longimicrobiales bacterium]